MHYGEDKQLKDSKLEIVVYKHEVLSFKRKAIARNKNGVVSKRCVDYEISSIRCCEKFSPRVLNRILNDPYKHLSKDLDFLPFEEWILVRIIDLDGYGKIEVKPISVVSDHPDETMRLH
jgi:hypothetical protein